MHATLVIPVKERVKKKRSRLNMADNECIEEESSADGD